MSILPLILQGQDIILVDTSNTQDIDQRIKKNAVTEIIDHRALHQADQFPNAHVQIELVGAAATLIAEKFFRASIHPSKDASTLLYGAIISNTMNFKSAITTKRDTDMAAWLQKIASIDTAFGRKMLLAKSDLTGKSLKTVIESDLPTPKTMGNKTILVGQLEIIGVKHLYETRREELQQALMAIKKEKRVDFLFLNGVDLEEGKNYILYTTLEEKNLFMTLGNSYEENGYLVRDTLIVRKEILPILHKHFQPQTS